MRAETCVRQFTLLSIVEPYDYSLKSWQDSILLILITFLFPLLLLLSSEAARLGRLLNG